MKRGGTLLALGLGLLAAGFGRAGEGDTPAAVPAAPLVAPAHPGDGGGCGGCCGGARGSCWQQLCAFFSYRALPVPWCCRCMGGCCRAYACHPPVYTYFLAEPCHEGHWYGNGPCCGCRGHHLLGCHGGCGGAGPDPRPVVPQGPIPVGAVIPGLPPGPAGHSAAPHTATLGAPTAPLGDPVGPPVARETAPMPAPVPARP